MNNTVYIRMCHYCLVFICSLHLGIADKPILLFKINKCVLFGFQRVGGRVYEFSNDMSTLNVRREGGG